MNVNSDEIINFDFKNYLTGADIISSSDRTKIYEIETQSRYQRSRVPDYDIILPYRSLPLTALIFLPLATYDYTTAYQTFLIFSIGMIFVFYFTNREILSKNQFFLLLMLLFFPNYTNFFSGQIVFFYLCVFLFIYRFVKKDQALGAGLVSGLLILRPQYLLFIPFMIYMTRKPKRFLIGFAGSLVVNLTISLWLVGLESMLNYPSFLVHTETPLFGSHILSMFSFVSVIGRSLSLFKIDLNFQELMILNFLLFSLAFLLIKKRFVKADLDLQFSSALLLMLPFMGHVYRHDLVLFVIPLFIVLSRYVSPLMLVTYVLINFSFKFLTPFFLVASAFSVLAEHKDGHYLRTMKKIHSYKRNLY